MPPLANQRHEAFARLISRGEAASTSYGNIYHVSDHVAETAGSRLMRNVRVAERVAELKGQAANRTLIDIEFLTNELLENARRARAAKQFAAVTSSLGLIAKLHGLVIDKQESMVLHRPAPLPTKLLELTEEEWVAQFSTGTGPRPALTGRAGGVRYE
ncbi:terminase small subunit [Rhizobium ruizarguesonis]|nr:Terminase small subunit [Rhizobium leguminosarum]